MVGAKTMTGINGNSLNAVPHDALRNLMAQPHSPVPW